jgi:hypothetical protein
MRSMLPRALRREERLKKGLNQLEWPGSDLCADMEPRRDKQTDELKAA